MTRDDGRIDDPYTEGHWTEWVAAGATRSWCRRNELLDWLEIHGIERGFTPDTMRAGYDERFDFGRWVSERGRLFEEAVLAHLASLVTLTRIGGARTDARSLQAAEETWRAMARGDGAITQGVLRDPQARMYGKVDLLVRSDVLARMCADAFGEEDDPADPAPALDGAPWHYRAVDVKFTTVELLKGGLLSTATELATCAQLWVYNAALGRLQGLTPPFAYVVGRGWRQGKERGDVCWERLGRVARDGFIKGRDMTVGDAVALAARWVRRVRAEGAGWNALPRPTVPELWPNMREGGDGIWHAAKVEIARELGEITLLRTINVGHRETAHAAGITRWDDPRVSAATLGLTGARDPLVLDAILRVHREGEPVQPARIAADEGRWRERAALELYIDFETVNDLDDDFRTFPRRGGTPLIFQIGCGRYEDGIWTFDQFTAGDLTIEAEGVMIDEWVAHLERLALARGLRSASDARLFHWSAAETVFMDAAFNSARERHPEKSWPDLGWYDVLRNVVQAEPVVIRGSMGFGLKSVARALHALGHTATDWGEGLADGTGAMAGAWLAAAEARRSGGTLSNVALMREIDRYNEIDCRVMAEVLDYLRREH
ncbi:MAG: hypothetical protein M3Q61_02010 [Chloroflexota bacterium]|nr:hypothetical protein [Chloroflexota bacterium]